MTNNNLAKFFFWVLLITNTVGNYTGLKNNDSLIFETYFPLVEALQFPIITFSLIALYSLGYNCNAFSRKTFKLIASSYLFISIYHILAPVIYYWEQTANLSIDIIIFLLTDFIIFYIIWRQNNDNEHIKAT
ncbi:hypothetical protein CGK63_24290 [Vibrio parahaemolyticus]|nr:hypothetical protein C1S87_24645 [Vibrio parahaemolyticus]PMT83924.1 hypothetical protein C1S83_25115 [Vibrio parahaemolyticus]PMT85449.1 hypothetical protein C1T03_25050 [Vibrio parahaemolyticus]TBT61825.1 hypothetical protein D5E73_24520 [Vibrio parahaemolyticus]TBT71288.1 hypothetical protein D5E72_24505 [Vibrio parahaemolyticus]